jgi:RNHCP domain
MLVGPVPSGGHQRNHCPLCLYSRHLDDQTPGDRASTCRALMVPDGVYTRRNGEYVLVHICLACGVVRHNRIAADDNFSLVLALSEEAAM